jgi:tetratricopeptide (TPR) repeat protein
VQGLGPACGEKVADRPARRRGEPRGDSALRLAQLRALATVLKRLDAALQADVRSSHRRNEAHRFSAGLAVFIAEQTESTETLGFVHEEDATEEAAVRRAVLDALPTAFDQSLAARRANGDHAAIVESVGQIRRVVETAVLVELRLTLLSPGEEPPAPFPALFFGVAASDGWFDFFIHDVAARIQDARAKSGGAFGKIWNTEQLALVKAITEAHSAVLVEINERTSRIEQIQTEFKIDITDKLDELLALVRAAGAFQRAAEEGISANAVRVIVERLGGEGVSRDDLLPWVDNWIETARFQLDRYSNEGEPFEAARREAERRFKAGYLREASAAFMDEFAREERLEAERQNERKHHRLRLLEEAIQFDELALNAPAVIPKLFMIADIEGVQCATARGVWLSGKATEFYERGRDQGINVASAIAIEVYRAVLRELPRELVPLQWAKTQSDLGTALAVLGQRENGTTRLEEGVTSLRAALEERTRERVPFDWAKTQNSLGIALGMLGARETGTARLEEAAIAFRAALAENTRERVPLDWARNQNNLGLALWSHGERESGTARLEEAVTAFRKSLQEQTREQSPFGWAQTQNNLGIALMRIGERERDSAAGGGCHGIPRGTARTDP